RSAPTPLRPGHSVALVRARYGRITPTESGARPRMIEMVTRREQASPDDATLVASGAADESRRTLLLIVIGVALSAILPYLTSLGNGFALDDVPIIRDNPIVHSLGDPARLWTTPYWPLAGPVLGLYRPLTTFVFA